jgi:hypothetical protein
MEVSPAISAYRADRPKGEKHRTEPMLIPQD